ncbi:MAG: cupin domain-containing protein [Caldilineaceae bacterium]
MPFYTPDEREGKELFEGIVARTYWGEKLMVVVADIAPNGVVPPHSHPHEQAGIVLEGELTFTIEDETKLLKVGDVYVIPSNVEHTVVARDMPCKVLDIFSGSIAK